MCRSSVSKTTRRFVDPCLYKYFDIIYVLMVACYVTSAVHRH